VRRFMASMLVVAAALSTPLIAQSSSPIAQLREPAWIVGLAATVGSGWQIEGADIGWVRPLAFGPLRSFSVTGRFGTFQDESSVMTGSRGFIGGLSLATQSRPLPVFEVGTEQNPIKVALDLTLEVSGYLAQRSPFPQGAQWFSVGVLPSVRTIQGDATGFGLNLMLGPVVFLGHETDVRTFLGFRVEIPVAAPPQGP
jgi:hypothetical protein